MPALNIVSRPSAQQSQSMVVLFHGYGASAPDLIVLADVWAQHMLTTHFVSLDAPHGFEMGAGRYWFTLEDYDMSRIRREIKGLVPAVEETVLKEMQTLGLTWADVAFCGFSQGAALALALALYDLPVCGALGYAGVFVPTGEPVQDPAPQICMIHGDADEVVPVSFFEHSRAQLVDMGVPFEGFVSEGLGHYIDTPALNAGGDFLKRLLLSKEDASARVKTKDA